MLQRAASNAYSWWWASNIRTNQSKWLDNNLQEMEEKVKAMLKIIDEDADSFAKRAEMYYKKRPELMNFVEDTYKAYKALAERFDRISGELHKANHTIATAFPDQVQFAIQDEDDDCLPKAISSIDSSKMHKPPSEISHASSRTKNRPEHLTIRKSKHRRVPSQFSKEKAHEEIDRLQKAILVLHTDKEFIKSSYESGLAKFLDIEKQIGEMQEEVCFLQDHFGASSVIEDDEARALMAAAALKSCEDTLVNLQEKQNRSTKEARIESARIKHAEVKLQALKGECNQSQVACGHTSDEKANLEEHICILKPGRLELQTLCEKVKLHFEMNSEASVAELAEKIDALVDKVISLELTVSSQTVEIRNLRTETDELHKQLQSLQEEKMTPTNDSNNLSERLKQAEKKLQAVQDLEKCIEDEKNTLCTHLTGACYSLNDLSEKLWYPNCKDQHTVAGSSSQGSMNSHLIVEPYKEERKEEVAAKITGTKELVSQLEGGAEAPEATAKNVTVNQGMEKKLGEEVVHMTEVPPSKVEPQVETSSVKDAPCIQDIKGKLIEEHVESRQIGRNSGSLKSLKEEDKTRNIASSQTVDSIGPSGEADAEDGFLNLQQLLSTGLAEREKILLAEYTFICRNYREVKRKLSEVEKKNQDSLSEIIAQLRDLMSTNALKDEEIRLLRENVRLRQESSNENKDPSIAKAANPFLNKLVSFSRFSKLRTESSKRRSSEISEDPKVEREAAKGASFNVADTTSSHTEEINLRYIQEPHAASAIEGKIRRDIDTVLEENLDFWLRFSTTFHHVQKLQTTFEDLQTEIENLKDGKTSDGRSFSSSDQSQAPGSVPIDKRLRELKTELQVWLEQNAMLKGELKQRFSSLCDIQDEISRAVQENSGGGEVQFTPYQAAKFQGEVLNMQQENNKVSNELEAGLDHVRGLQTEIENALSKLQEKFELSGLRSNQSNHPHHHSIRNLSSKTKIPLKSFLYGAKPKKPSIFSCMTTALHKHHNDIRAGLPSKHSSDHHHHHHR